MTQTNNDNSDLLILSDDTTDSNTDSLLINETESNQKNDDDIITFDEEPKKEEDTISNEVISFESTDNTQQPINIDQLSDTGNTQDDETTLLEDNVAIPSTSEDSFTLTNNTDSIENTPKDESGMLGLEELWELNNIVGNTDNVEENWQSDADNWFELPTNVTSNEADLDNTTWEIDTDSFDTNLVWTREEILSKAITDLTSRTDIIESQINTKKDHISDLKTQISSLEKEVSSCEWDVDQLNFEESSITKNIKALEKMKTSSDENNSQKKAA